MKAHKRAMTRPFIRRVIELEHLKKHMAPMEIHVFNINGNYGHYQIEIGPEYSAAECESMHLKPHTRPLMINGEIHHLFMTRNALTPTPTHEEVNRNLRGTVIMKNLKIHILDNDGTGESVKIEKMEEDGVNARECINLAGERGSEMMKDYKSTGRLAKETYKLIQQDILHSLEQLQRMK